MNWTKRSAHNKQGVRKRMNIDIDIFDCLIDTVERTTDLEGVYNDKTGKFFTWEEIHKAREEIHKAREENV